MKRIEKWWLAPTLCVCVACGGGGSSALTQAPAPAATPTPQAGPKEDCAPWPEVAGAVYARVLGRPAEGEELKRAADRLAGGETSVRRLVAELAASEEYRGRFVAKRPAEEAAHELYRRLLGREPEAAESKATAAALGSSGGHAAAARALVEGAEYAKSYGEAGIPGAPAGLRPCRFPLTLRRHDEFGPGRSMLTELRIEQSGQIKATTKLTAGAQTGAAARELCGKVGLWLLDESGAVVGVVGPPPAESWCAGRGQEQRSEQWQVYVPPDSFRRVASVALLQRSDGPEPQIQTRENRDLALKIRQPVR